MNLRWLVGVLSVFATGWGVPSSFAGTVDVAIPIAGGPTASLSLPIFERVCPEPACGELVEPVESAWPTCGLDAWEIRETSYGDPLDAGHILNLAHRTLTSSGFAAATSRSEVDSADAAGNVPTGPSRTGENDARALALPDAVRMFPLGAVVAALAIRRMRRSVRRA